VAKVVFVQLEDQPDTLKWNLTRHDVFTVQSMYNYYIHSNFVPTNKHMWKLKLPLKIKVFVWFLIKGVILTKDNLVKRNWIGSERCCFCNNNETIQHLLFDCHVSHFIWRTIHVAFGLRPPHSVAHLFGNWLQGIDKKNTLPSLGGSDCCLLVYLAK